MNLTLDDATAKRTERQLARGHFREPAEVVAYALALLEDQEDWLLRDQDAKNLRLDESHARIERIPNEQVRRILKQDLDLRAEFYRRRAQRTDGTSLCAILDLAPDVPPDPGDEL